MKKNTYKQFTFYEFADDSNYKKISTDSKYWRTYYSFGDTNLIMFFPFSEYHGGGQPYIIEIGKIEFETWINQNMDFENEIRIILEKKLILHLTGRYMSLPLRTARIFWLKRTVLWPAVRAAPGTAGGLPPGVTVFAIARIK